MITKKDVARELLRRRAARSSLIGYAKFIDVPGAPVGDDDTETFLPAETDWPTPRVDPVRHTAVH